MLREFQQEGSYNAQLMNTLLTLKLRMEYAAELLSKGEFSISQVAAMAGYGDTGSFYRAFTRYYGKTPKAYRAGE